MGPFVMRAQEMIRPGLLAVLSPCAVGLGFRVLGYYTGQTLLGAKAVAGLLMFSMVAGNCSSPCTFRCQVAGETP